MKQHFLKRLVLPGLLALVLLATMGGSNPDAFANNGDRGIDRAVAAQEAHTDALFGITGVVGTAVGLGGNGRAVVFVLTESAGVTGIPGMLDGVTVVQQVTGRISALHHQSGHCGGPPGSELDPICEGGGDPIPGITVSPTSGLVTTEGGGTAVFSVVLDTLPGSDVTIAISSSKPTEGTVSPALLTFTAIDGTTAQNVIITGVDDEVDDGPIGYTIITGIAASGDEDYNGIDPADVSVTNIDDDGVISFPRPANIGTSSGTERLFNIDGEEGAFCSVGTLGARVKHGDNVYALSNAHIYALEGSSPIGDVSTARILQPGLVDLPTVCGTPEEVDAAVIGNLAKWVPLTFGNTTSCTTVSTSTCNRVDAAIASTTTGDVDTATPQDGYGSPKSLTVAPAVGLKVQKYGRTTGLTSGRIWAINASVNIGYDKGVARFIGQMIVRGGGFSLGGDSGSLVVINGGSDDRASVGLLFAGSINTTIISPIDDVLTELDALLGVGTLTIDGE